LKKFPFIITILCILLVGCTNIQNQHTEIENNDSAKQFYTEEKANEALKDLYGLEHLENHDVYMIEDKIFIDLHFNSNVERKEMNDVRTFIMKIFVIKNTSKYGTPIPYQQLIINKTTWNSATSKIYVNKVKILEEEYANNKVKYFENTDVSIPLRLLKDETIESFEKAIKENLQKVKTVICEKSLKGDILIVKMNSTTKYQQNDINSIKSLIENELAIKLSDKSVNSNTIGIVLQLYSKEGKYFEETYFNAKEKYWFTDDWMNYPYYEKAYSS
jgi:hypothetical protein